MIARYREALKNETTAGVVLIIGAVLALIWANFPLQGAREAYDTLANTTLFELHGHDMSLSLIAADLLLALFFFIVGMELKQEFVIGSLHDIRKALVPILAAVFGMAGPMLVYIAIQLLSADPNWNGWAVPVATDIAFALGVLGLFGKGLPIALRTFLMTLAVVDDLLGIIIIAIFFSDHLNFGYLALSLLVVAIFGYLAQKRILNWYFLWPLGLVAWLFMFMSGIHATIAGVLLGMTIPTIQRSTEKLPLTEHLTEKLEFYSAGFILPIFAFFAAGVNVVDSGGFLAMLTDPAAIGIYLGLPLGKTLGITGGVAIMLYVFKLELGKGLYLGDINAVALIAGIGFTVSLLIATLSFPGQDPAGPHARVAVLLGTLISLVLGAIALRGRAKWHAKNAPVYDMEHLAENRATLERHEVLADDWIEETFGEVPGGEPEVGPGHYDR
ncbi:Na+/H+ antiporter NhaA [Trueperella pyogenes]|uniref:Na+/H+ antiporter NhaA n=1 Tax=Trueperella pyogenes TaxID=1661 RepID=UPI00043B11D0|nr:Na+/H+ antiporter NhaA [Trueperella pyogenes]AHU89568.1 pH-dependent sodium/proton antiporter [Trueperella pyogenes]AZR01015.1 Na+/H+ antiporter NhaA [Trueperella pyogenes]AZR02260.1 Na+/H+ antiporter NhaA [Trueperella pyogenes]MDF2420478.1 Na+/H+ antiporter NhaA [Trueperella pyogenes]OQD37469.1 Na+/H+ antiporter NhaA [Trueperella pyogenes]